MPTNPDCARLNPAQTLLDRASEESRTSRAQKSPFTKYEHKGSPKSRCAYCRVPSKMEFPKESCSPTPSKVAMANRITIPPRLYPQILARVAKGGDNFKMVAARLRSEHGLRVCGEAVRKIIRRL